MANKLDNLTPFKKGQSGNPKGSKKTTVTLLKQQGLNKNDIYNAIVNMIGLTKDELKKIRDDKNSEVYKVVIAGAIVRDIEKRRIYTIESIFDRVFGKPTQKQQVSGGLTIKNRLFDK